MNKKVIHLRNELKLMNDASSILNYSYKKCLKIKISKKYTLRELDAFEALTARFARLNDIIIQRVLKSVHLIDLDDANTIRDSINLAEKKNLIKSAQKMIEMRELRNSIVHEYIPEIMKSVFKTTMKLTPLLLNNVRLINSYCKHTYQHT